MELTKEERQELDDTGTVTLDIDRFSKVTGFSKTALGRAVGERRQVIRGYENAVTPKKVVFNPKNNHVMIIVPEQVIGSGFVEK